MNPRPRPPARGMLLAIALFAAAAPADMRPALGQVSQPTANASSSESSERVPSLPTRFRSHESRHFLVYSDASVEWTRSRIALLERTAHQFQRFASHLGRSLEYPQDKLICILFERYEDFAAFAQRADNVTATWIAGYYAGRANRIVFYNDQSAPSVQRAREQLEEARGQLELIRQRHIEALRRRDTEAIDFYAAQRRELEALLRQEEARQRQLVRKASDAKAIHEATHLLAFNTGLQLRSRQYPFWFTEGLAVCFETDAPNAAFGPDRDYQPRRRRVEELFAEEMMLPLREFVALIEVPGACAQTADIMYHQAYSLMMYLYRYKKGELARFLDLVAAEPAGRITESRQLELFESAFGPVDTLERRWLTHERKR